MKLRKEKNNREAMFSLNLAILICKQKVFEAKNLQASKKQAMSFDNKISVRPAPMLLLRVKTFTQIDLFRRNPCLAFLITHEYGFV